MRHVTRRENASGDVSTSSSFVVNGMFNSPCRTTSAAHFTEALRSRIGLFDVYPASGMFSGQVDSREAGLSVAGDILCSALTVRRTSQAASISTSDHAFKIVWQVSGFGEMEQSGRILQLRPGQLALYRLSRRYQLQTSHDYHAVTLSFDLSEMPQWQPLADRLSARAFDVDAATHAALAMTRSLFSISADESTGYVMSQAVGLVFKSLLRLARDDDDAAPMPSLCLEQARRVTSEHLADPDFSPDDLARVLKISRRSLYSEFRRHGISAPAAFIRDLRLARCRAALLDPAMNHRSVTEIAFGNGFSDSTYFSRAFRNSYGVAPSQFRKRSRHS